ncbi:MAG: hypothetical protein LBB18_03490 [Puniceicoccales bacterium]|jgi:hypothetical protein|nr:hypothetical protein [Puniceicoccales bacterium]
MKIPQVSLLCIILGIVGCSSTAKTHHQRLERICRVHDEIAEIARELQDIQQIMLYVGRIRDNPIADRALDVAISIHGEPDVAEKQFAENMTIAEIEKISASAAELLKRMATLEAISRKEKAKAIDESYAIHALESRYKFCEQLISRCLVAVCAVAAFLFLRKIF